MAGISVDVVSPVVQMGSEAGYETASNELNNKISKAKNKVGSLIRRLNQNYTNMFNKGTRVSTIINKRQDIQNQIASIRNEASLALRSIHNSIKTGDDIMPKEAEEKIKEISNDLYKRLKTERENSYGSAKNIKDKNEYKKIALETMAMIYELREQLTGIEEKIVVAYEGESSKIYAIDVPITKFLKSKGAANTLTISSVSTSGWYGNDPFQLSFNNSIISQLQTIANQGENQPLSNLQVTKDRFIQTKLDLDNFLLEQGILEELTDRKDKKYRVVKRGAAGYIVENLINNFFKAKDNSNDELTDISQRGVDAWYTGGDFMAGNVSYSAKSMLYGNATLTKMSTIQNILEQLYLSLNSTQDYSSLVQDIANLLHIKIQDLNNVVSNDIDKILNILTG